MSELLHLNDSNFESTVNSADKPMIVDFWATWCPPCRALGPHIEKMADEFAGKIIIAKADTEETQNAARKFGVSSIPCVVALRNGVEVGRVVGNYPAKVHEMAEKLLYLFGCARATSL